jgi:hypothetical protein
MKAGPALNLELQLRMHLRHRTMLIPSEVDEVLLGVNQFTAAIIQNGFRTAVTQVLGSAKVRLDRPFIEVCDGIVEHHLRTIEEEALRNLLSKSLFEAYLYFAGTQYAFDPPGKTRLSRSLRLHGVKGFAELFLSLHLFNVVSLEIQDTVAARMTNLRAFEIYMLGIEAVCRDIVARALKSWRGEPDELWAAGVRRNIEQQLIFQQH